MDHIGIDVHKRESQIYILGEGARVDTASLFIERQHETHSPSRLGSSRPWHSADDRWLAYFGVTLTGAVRRDDRTTAVVLSDRRKSPIFPSRPSIVTTRR